MKKYPLFLYFSVVLGILSWWGVAFWGAKPPVSNALSSSPQTRHNVSPLAQLSHLDRDSLKQALDGNFSLMTQLIADWDVDAQILIANGHKKIKRLPTSTFLRSQLLGRSLSENLTTSKKRKFLPQSYAAASFLLALVDPDQIVALPNGLRKQSHIYPKSLTSQIPLDVDRYNSEKLFLARPDVAFVSSYYSHPSAVQALRNQGIQIHATRSLESLSAIRETLNEIGTIVDREKEADLLNIFIEASLATIENRLIKPDNVAAAKILYLSYHDQFYLPSHDMVSCELLRRLGIAVKESSGASQPLHREKIVHLNPDCLIISTTQSEALQRQMGSDPALKNVSAVLNRHVYFVDDDIQQTPTHYIVLAYYDLAQVLATANLP